ncbi:MAG TPA: S1 RNA-binding domain-containing protein, partial [Candidatus Nosocomiicoccus stercorigallinarum]|nr:S1 RNA-binding domain-containing protein [Candidatus Nosocomiicoccus stercorigallinarum]
IKEKLNTLNKRKYSEENNIGLPTLNDIIDSLITPLRDIRDKYDTPILKSDVLELSDLKEGMKLSGTVRNVTDFGAFVDVGVGQDGLVHISQLANRYIKHPLDVVSSGDIVEVTVLSVDEKKKRIALTMKK